VEVADRHDLGAEGREIAVRSWLSPLGITTSIL
jgi:hypothetical protein